MLANITEMLKNAQKRGDAVASVNVYSLESIHAAEYNGER